MMQGVQATQEALEKGVAEARQKLDEVLKELIDTFNKLKEKSVEGNKDALAVVSTRVNDLIELCEKRLQELLEKLKESYERNVSEENRVRVEKTIANVRETVEKTLSDVRTTYDTTRQEGAKRVDEVSKKADELAKKLTAWGVQCTGELQSTLARLQKDHLNVSGGSFDQVTEAYAKLSDVAVPLPSRIIAFIMLVIQAFFVLIKTSLSKKDTYAAKAAAGASAHNKKE